MYKELRLGPETEVMLYAIPTLMATGSVITSGFSCKTYGSSKLFLVIKFLKTHLDETQTLDFKITFESWIQLIMTCFWFFHILEKLRVWKPQFN